MTTGFIELSSLDYGQLHLFRVAHISRVTDSDGWGVCVELMTGKCFRVRESYEHVLELIDKNSA